MSNITYWHDMPSNITGIGDFIVWSNNASGNVLGMFLLIAAFIISFVSLKIFGTSKAFATSSFISFIFAILLWTIGILNFVWVTVTIIATIFSVLILKSDADKFGI